MHFQARLRSPVNRLHSWLTSVWSCRLGTHWVPLPVIMMCFGSPQSFQQSHGNGSTAHHHCAERQLSSWLAATVTQIKHPGREVSFITLFKVGSKDCKIQQQHIKAQEQYWFNGNYVHILHNAKTWPLRVVCSWSRLCCATAEFVYFIRLVNIYN